MGFKKHRHSKDKLYIRSTEWAEEFGGFKKQSSLRLFKRLPFDSCCISLAPFENPMCDKKGNCFELLNIVPWLKQYGTNPVTGEKMKGIFLTNLFNLFWGLIIFLSVWKRINVGENGHGTIAVNFSLCPQTLTDHFKY